MSRSFYISSMEDAKALHVARGMILLHLLGRQTVQWPGRHSHRWDFLSGETRCLCIRLVEYTMPHTGGRKAFAGHGIGKRTGGARMNASFCIGFEHVACFFKWLELAVFGGVKR